MFLIGYPMEAKTASKTETRECIFLFRLASFGQLGLISDPLIISCLCVKGFWVFFFHFYSNFNRYSVTKQWRP